MMGKIFKATILCLTILVSVSACGSYDVNTISTGTGECSSIHVDILSAKLDNGVLTFTSSQIPNTAIRVDIVTDQGKASVIGSVPSTDSGVTGITPDGRKIRLRDSESTVKPLDNNYGVEMKTRATIKSLDLTGSLQSLTFSRLDAKSGQQTGEGCTIHMKK